VKSSASAFNENDKDLFVLCPVGRTASNVQNIHFLYRTCSDFNPIPLHTIERTMKEFLKPPCEKEPSIEERKVKGILREQSRIFSPSLPRTLIFLFFQEIFNCFHLFHRIQQVLASAQVKLLGHCSRCPLLKMPFSLCSALLY